MAYTVRARRLGARHRGRHGRAGRHPDRGRHDPRGRPARLRRPGRSARDFGAAGRLIHPGLINAHTHSHGNLAKGMGDRWTLELLLTAAPWLGGNRGADDIHLSAQIGAVEMVLKGCTACYDLFFEWPVPSRDGIGLVASAYAEVGMRAVIAPMVADRTFYEAIPGLADALPPALQERVAALRLAPGEATLAAIRDALHHWSHRPRPGPPGGRADHPAPLLGRFHHRLRRPGARLRCRPAQPCRRVESPGGDRHPAIRRDPDRASRPARRHRTAFHGGARRLARP